MISPHATPFRRQPLPLLILLPFRLMPFSFRLIAAAARRHLHAIDAYAAIAASPPPPPFDARHISYCAARCADIFFSLRHFFHCLLRFRISFRPPRIFFIFISFRRPSSFDSPYDAFFAFRRLPAFRLIFAAILFSPPPSYSLCAAAADGVSPAAATPAFSLF